MNPAAYFGCSWLMLREPRFWKVPHAQRFAIGCWLLVSNDGFIVARMLSESEVQGVGYERGYLVICWPAAKPLVRSVDAFASQVDSRGRGCDYYAPHPARVDLEGRSLEQAAS